MNIKRELFKTKGEGECFFCPARSRHLERFQTTDASTCNMPWHPLFVSICFAGIELLRHMSLDCPLNVKFESSVAGIFIYRSRSTGEPTYVLLRTTSEDETPETPCPRLPECGVTNVYARRNTHLLQFEGSPPEGVGLVLQRNRIRRARCVLPLSNTESRLLQRIRRDIDIVPESDPSLVQSMLLFKKPLEHARIRQACAITQHGFAAGRACVLSHAATNTRLQVRHFIDAFEGAIAPFHAIEYAYVPIVTQRATIHAPLCLEEELDPYRPIVVDMGVRWQGMCSDITRTFCVPPPPQHQHQHLRPNNRSESTWPARLHALLLDTLEHIVRMVKPGVTFQTLSETCAQRLATGLAALGLVDPTRATEAVQHLMPHAVGHSIGWNVHDDGVQPRDGTWTLREGQTLALEPGLYFPDLDKSMHGIRRSVYDQIVDAGVRAMRIEDTMCVTRHGVDTYSASIPRSLFIE
jgi:Xaa-Pro aminopeptidase